jgi:multiple sugar transport system permease protein
VRLPRNVSEAVIGVLLITPAAVFLLTFFVAPLLLMLWMSFHDWPLLGKTKWIGLKNYLSMFSSDVFVGSLKFTSLYTLILVPLLLVIGLGLAMIVRRKGFGVGILRTIFFAPVVVGFAPAAYLCIFIVDPRVGLLDQALRDTHIVASAPEWLSDPRLALVTAITMVVWKTAGFGMLLLLTGLLSIPEEVNEAARIDGAGPVKLFRMITLPLLRRPIALTLTFGLVGGALAFEQFFLLTGGGPNNSTTTIVHAIYSTSFGRFDLGLGAAMSIFLMLVLILVSSIQLYLLRDSRSEN